MSEYGLDCQSRRSKSCVVNNGTLSTEVLRVVIGYRSTRSKLFRLFGFRSKRWPKQWRRRTSPGSRRTNNRAHFSQQRDHGRAELCLRLCISTGYEPWARNACACMHVLRLTVGWTLLSLALIRSILLLLLCYDVVGMCASIYVKKIYRMNTSWLLGTVMTR